MRNLTNKKVKLTLAAAAVAFGISAVVASPASAESITYVPPQAPYPIAGQVVTLTAVHSGKVLDNPAWSENAGTQMIQWGANGGKNQQWFLEPVNLFTEGPNVNRHVAIHNLHSGMCLEPVSTAQGAAVQQQWCEYHDYQSKQVWHVIQNSDGTWSFETSNGYRLDIAGASGSNGAAAIVWPNNNQANQRFSAQTVANPDTSGVMIVGEPQYAPEPEMMS